VSFKVGDVCVIVRTVQFHEYLGRECVVTGPLEMRHDSLSPDGESLRYEIECDGKRFTPFPDQLRLKRPPSDDKQEPRADFTPGEWDLCPWKPNRVKA